MLTLFAEIQDCFKIFEIVTTLDSRSSASRWKFERKKCQ